MAARTGPSRRRPDRLLALALAVELVAACGAAVVLQERDERGRADQTRSRVAPEIGAVPQSVLDRRAREAGVRALLDARAAAVLARDEAAFLATVDPASTALLERQRAVFAALAEVPLSSWSYELQPRSARLEDPELDARYGEGTWWSPDVLLRYALDGFDSDPAVQQHFLTFVERDGRWLLAADDDFADEGSRTATSLWDLGPVTVVRGTASLVLGHPQDAALMRSIATTTDAAVPRVTGVWGQDWAQKVVVLVPADQEELRTLLGSEGDFSQIAAVATAELTDDPSGFHPVGDRVIVNPPNFAKLGRVGRRVVLTHEVLHVASRQSTGPDVPAWLVEGLADYAGYLDVDVPVQVAAKELREDVRAGRLPTALPTEVDFDGGNPALPQAYEKSWLAVKMLVERHGAEAVVRLYRQVGRSRGGSPGAPLEAALQDVLGTTTAQVTEDWRAYVRRSLS